MASYHANQSNCQRINYEVRIKAHKETITQITHESCHGMLQDALRGILLGAPLVHTIIAKKLSNIYLYIGV